MTVRMASQRVDGGDDGQPEQARADRGNSRNSEVSRLTVLSSVGIAWGTSPWR